MDGRPAWADVPFVGFSATPWAKGMAKHWRALLKPVTIGELIDGGFLSPFRVFCPPEPDLKGVRKVAGEYHEGDLSAVVDQPKLIGDIVENYLAKGDGEQALFYGVDRRHAQHAQERFIERGIVAEYIDCDTLMFQREENL